MPGKDKGKERGGIGDRRGRNCPILPLALCRTDLVWVIGWAYNKSIQLGQVWPKLQAPLLACKTEEEVTAAFKLYAEPYADSFVPRVDHGLKRLVVIGSDGMISFAAIRWLADQNASFVMLERDGSLLATTGPVHPSMHGCDVRRLWLSITKPHFRLLDASSAKKPSDSRVAGERLQNGIVAETIDALRCELKSASSLESVLAIEAKAASAYWSAWSELPIQYPRTDIARVPDHWQVFGALVSPLTGSPRSAVNPPNAVLNYLYAMLEAEARLAAAELGLDPGLGVLHRDTPNRDSLACDLMEPVRPLVDAFVFDWLNRGPLPP